jgi:hypothetical protein
MVLMVMTRMMLTQPTFAYWVVCDIQMGQVNEGTSDQVSPGQLPPTENPTNRHQSQQELDMEQREVVTDEHSVTNVEETPIEEDAGEERNDFEGDESEEEGDCVHGISILRDGSPTQNPCTQTLFLF